MKECCSIIFTLLSEDRNAVGIFKSEEVLGASPMIQKRCSYSVGFILVGCVGSVSHVYVSFLRALLLGLASNHNLKGVSLDLSNCEVRIPLHCTLEEITASASLCLFPGKNVIL